MAYTKRITYSKEFLTGTLAGLCVHCSFPTTDDAVGSHMASLNALKKSNPRTENGSTYWIYNLGCEDIGPNDNPYVSPRILRPVADLAEYERENPDYV